MKSQLIRLYINGVITGVSIEYYFRVKHLIWPLLIAILLFAVMTIEVACLFPYNKEK
jgi:hypothetical protein